MNMEEHNQNEKNKGSQVIRNSFIFVSMFVLVFIAVTVWGPSSQQTTLATGQTSTNSGHEGDVVQVSLPQTYALDVTYGDLGPQLLAAGAIDYDRFIQLYQQMERPLSSTQIDILEKGSDAPIVMDFENAHFLLNFFWAFGLANNNPILTEGPMMQYGAEKIGNFASTGGWTIGKRPATELYAGSTLITLNPTQQARLEEVAHHVYRPCCDNHTAFADCNHGMAMLGLLQLLASQDATVDEMFAAAKSVNGFWFPQQSLETAVYYKATTNLNYADVDPRLAVSKEIFSGSGYRRVNQWLAANNLLDQSPNNGNNCGVG